MPIEIERKFLVSGTPPLENGVTMVQGYLCHDIDRTIRIRTEGTRAVITIKSATKGISRAEFEYEIPVSDAQEMLGLAVAEKIRKTRSCVVLGNHTWEVDVFHDANAGLVVAEVELSQENEKFIIPEWVGEEISGEPKYLNSLLAQCPYSAWETDSD